MKRRRVKVTQIRKAHRAEPFVPFVLKLENGREIPVREPGLMLLPPRSQLAAIYDTDDACSVIDVQHVTDLEFKPAARRRKRA